ncbi:MAG: prolyl oligopeptidase family serine peptidase [Candidatus Nitrosocosmicus sp.]|nr:prolyl oligopeptidase family serine peptidase [Candidatus Nitrosocosmicus sp.]
MYISDINGQFNLWRYNSNLTYEGQCSPYPLTNFIDHSIRHFFSSPADNSLIFFADHQGDENFQIYKIDDIFNSWYEPITSDPKIRHEWGSECFSHDGKYITYGSNRKNPSDMLLYARNMNHEKDFCITDKEGWYIPGYWSPNNKKLNCSQLITLTDYAIWILDVENRSMEKINLEYEQKGKFIVGPWSVNQNGFYLLSDLNREFMGLAFYNIDTSKLEWILTSPYDIELIDISLDGKLLLWTENVDGYSKLYKKDMVNQEITEITPTFKKNNKSIPLNGVIEDLKLSTDGKRIGIMMDMPTSPTNIYLIDLEKNEEVNNCTRVTTSLYGNLSDDVLVKPQLIRYKSFDELEVSAFLYVPNNTNFKKINEKDKAKYGAILSIHGGPTAQERPYYDYSGLYQYLSNNGLTVIAPNFRGSTGYGKSFEKKIYHDWGGNELKDLEYAIKWLMSQDWIDPKRIGLFGASYGGFAALSCITRLPQYGLRAAVDIVGPSNLVTFVNTVPEHWKSLTIELVGDPVKERIFLSERSPITFADNINPLTSLLVIQGANDPRVVKSESDQIVERIREKGMDVEYMIFEDEGHGFTKYNNQIKALKKSAEFLLEKLSS